MASEPYYGEIRIFAGNFAPRGWAFCSGQLLSIQQNTALFSILGTFYGGDGRVTFALPDLRDRVPLHVGQGPGLSPYVVGQTGGEANHTLTLSELPAHTHTAMADSAAGSLASPAAHVWGAAGRGRPPAYSTNNPSVAMNTLALTPAGGGQPHNSLQPYLGLNFIIALQGIFPSRA